VSTIVFIEMPAFGHVTPSLPVVRELVRRGERVIYYVSEEFRSPVEAVGATFVAYPERVLTSTDIARATQTGDLTRVPALILRATESLLPFLLDELPRHAPDVLVMDSNALWGHMAAKRLNLPAVSLMTTIILSSQQYARLRPREWLHMLRPMLPGIPAVVAARSRLLRRFGKDAFPARPVFPARAGLNVVFAPRDLQPDSKLVDATFRFVGPTIDLEADGGDLPTDMLGPEPLVYISLGTLHRGSTDFFQQCFSAFGGMSGRFVLSVGRQADSQSLGQIPKNFIVRPFVPQLEVLRHASVFITHGGMNSALEGLVCGVPMVCIPQHVEQLLIGLNIASRGAGIVLRAQVAGQRVQAVELRHSVEQILSEPSFRDAASAAQTALRSTGGFRQAAQEIQAYGATNHRLTKSRP